MCAAVDVDPRQGRHAPETDVRGSGTEVGTVGVDENWDEWDQNDEVESNMIRETTIKIQNIPGSVTREAFFDVCSEFAPVKRFYLSSSRFPTADPSANDNSATSSASTANPPPTQHAYITYQSHELAEHAMKELKKLPFGETLRVSLTRTPEEYKQDRLNRIETKEMLRECGYENVFDDNPHHAQLRRCDFCGRDERRHTIRSCRGCDKVAYCSKACQRKRWDTHKKVCGSARDMKNTAIEASETQVAASLSEADEEVVPTESLPSRSINQPDSERNPSPTHASKSFEIRSPTFPLPCPLRKPIPCAIARVIDPSDISIVLRNDDADQENELVTRHFLLFRYIQSFVHNTQLREVMETVVVGAMVLAPMMEDDEDDINEDDDMLSSTSFHRAIVTKVADDKELGESVVDVWFCDDDSDATSVPLTQLIPYDAFADYSRAQGLPDAIVNLPPRLIRCRLCATAWESGLPAPISPFDGDNDCATSTWHPDSISFLQQLTGVSMTTPLEIEVLGLDTCEDGGIKWLAVLRGGDVNVGDALVDYEYAECVDDEG